MPVTSLAPARHWLAATYHLASSRNGLINHICGFGYRKSLNFRTPHKSHQKWRKPGSADKQHLNLYLIRAAYDNSPPQLTPNRNTTGSAFAQIFSRKSCNGELAPPARHSAAAKRGFREQHDNIYRRLLKIIEKVTIPALACAATAILAKRPAISASYRQKTRLITKADAYWLAV